MKRKLFPRQTLVSKTATSVGIPNEPWASVKTASGGNPTKWKEFPKGTRFIYVGLVGGKHVVDVPDIGQRWLENFDPFE